MMLAKNYETVFVKVVPRILVASFFPDMVYMRNSVLTVVDDVQDTTVLTARRLITRLPVSTIHVSMVARVVYWAPSETSPVIASLAIKVISLHT